MLKRNFFLDPSETKVGKKVYARSRPDMLGIIVDVKSTHPYANQTYTQLQIKVYYCRSKRTSKWLDSHYKFCDLDAYFRECSCNYTQAELLMQAAKVGEDILRKRNGNQVR